MTPERIQALAPDAASAKAAQGLAAPRHWKTTGSDGHLLWGECQGSGSTPYQTRVDVSSVAYKCSCPSRKFPCKHVLGLLLLHAADPLATAQPPPWVAQWLAEREAKAQKSAERGVTPSAPAADPAAAAAAAAKRAKSRVERVRAGLEECALWLRDVVRLGLAHAQSQPPGYWEQRAARLVDAQCPGVARRVRALGAIGVQGAGWESRLLEALGEIALLCDAFARLDALPPALQADVRRHIGWSQTQDEILARAFDAVEDEWTVAGVRVTEDERLTVHRTWLRGARSRRDALLLQFVVAGAVPADPMPPGTRFRGRVVYLESASPLRGVVAERSGFENADELPHPADIDDALEAFAGALGGDPWLERFPFVLRQVTPLAADGLWFVRDARGRTLPLARELREPFVLHALAGARPLDVAGEWDGRAFLPLAVSTAARFTALT
jgi:hypothetical protein